MFVCCVLAVRGLCDVLITRPEESYKLWRVVVCCQESSRNEAAIARAGLHRDDDDADEIIIVIITCSIDHIIFVSKW
jgi:hypothetical protein